MTISEAKQNLAILDLFLMTDNSKYFVLLDTSLDVAEEYLFNNARRFCNNLFVLGVDADPEALVEYWLMQNI